MYKTFSHTKQLDGTGKFMFLSKHENKTMIQNSVDMYMYLTIQ